MFDQYASELGEAGARERQVGYPRVQVGGQLKGRRHLHGALVHATFLTPPPPRTPERLGPLVPRAQILGGHEINPHRLVRNKAEVLKAPSYTELGAPTRGNRGDVGSVEPE